MLLLLLLLPHENGCELWLKSSRKPSPAEYDPKSNSTNAKKMTMPCIIRSEPSIFKASILFSCSAHDAGIKNVNDVPHTEPIKDSKPSNPGTRFATTNEPDNVVTATVAHANLELCRLAGTFEMQ